MSSADMYMENVLDYYKNPRNFGNLKDNDCSHEENNPLCGDEIKIGIKVKEDMVEDIKFNGKGCAISIAATSMLTEAVKGKKISEIMKMQKEDIIDMLGIPISPVRLKCALLCLEVLHKCINNYKK